MKYLANCFLLIIPILLWNIVFASQIPESYFQDELYGIPQFLIVGEHFFRILVFGIPLFMKFSLQSKVQKIGFGIYLFGMLFYFLSWIIQMYFPDSMYSNDLLIYTAPAYTTLIFFFGIGLIGQKSFLPLPRISLIYILSSLIFVVIHTVHIYLIYINL